VWLDGIVVKVHQERRVINKSVHVVLGVTLQGRKSVGTVACRKRRSEVLASRSDRASATWRAGHLYRQHGRAEGFAGSCQHCISQTLTNCASCICASQPALRHSKDSKAVAAALRCIYQSVMPSRAWRSWPSLKQNGVASTGGGAHLQENWDNIIPFFQFCRDSQGGLYHEHRRIAEMVLRKLTRNRRIFPNDTSALKSLALRSFQKMEIHPELSLPCRFFS